jgi:hypothetical protein
MPAALLLGHRQTDRAGHSHMPPPPAGSGPLGVSSARRVGRASRPSATRLARPIRARSGGRRCRCSVHRRLAPRSQERASIWLVVCAALSKSHHSLGPTWRSISPSEFPQRTKAYHPLLFLVHPRVQFPRRRERQKRQGGVLARGAICSPYVLACWYGRAQDSR